MTRYKHYPYQSWLKWVISPRQKHMIDALERRPEAFTGPNGDELRERLKLMTGWLKVRAFLIVLLFFSIVVTVVTWTMRAFDFVPGSEAVVAAVEAVSNVTTGASGVLAVVYALTLRTLGQLEMDAFLLLPSHREHLEKARASMQAAQQRHAEPAKPSRRHRPQRA